MSRLTLRRTERHDEARHPANKLALALAVAFLGFANGILGMIPGNFRALLPH